MQRPQRTRSGVRAERAVERRRRRRPPRRGRRARAPPPARAGGTGLLRGVDRVPRRHRADRMRLEHGADLVDLEDLARVLVQPGPDERAAPLGRAAGRHPPPARPAGLEQPERLEAREGLAENGARDAELLGQLPLGGKPVAGGRARPCRICEPIASVAASTSEPDASASEPSRRAGVALLTGRRRRRARRRPPIRPAGSPRPRSPRRCPRSRSPRPPSGRAAGRALRCGERRGRGDRAGAPPAGRRCRRAACAASGPPVAGSTKSRQ